MRALTRFLPLLLLAIAAVCLVPDAAAATAAGGAVVSPLAGIALVAGAGIVVRLSAKRHAADGTATAPERFSLDSDADNYAEQLEAYGEAKVEEGAAPIRSELAATVNERDAYRDMAIDEVVRVRQAEHVQLASSGQAEGEFDAAGERAFLESLTPDRLKLHFQRARQTKVSLTPQTSGEAPPAEGAEAAYGNVTTA